MPTERIQRQIDRLLDEAEAAVTDRDWPLVVARCEAVLRLDGGNADALGYLAAATVAPEPDGPRRAVAAPPLPTSFANGRFEVKALLGEGGRKLVYRAHDTQLDRDIAFALIKTDGLDKDERERVQREARTLGRLSSHPNIVTIHEIGEEPGGPWTANQGRASPTSQAQPFLVSELMQGGDLAQLIRAAPDNRLPLPRVLALGSAIGKALAFAHGKGIVHRDLKPGNVWLSEDGTPKLGDFGLATQGSDVRLTQAGMMVGTALYLAPEQAMGQEVTPKSDLYSLGCVLYELVTGRPPFVGDENVAIIGQHLNANPVAPAWHRPDCPKALEALILRLLEKDPAKRPAAATDVVDALSTIISAPALTPSRPAPAVTPPSDSANPVYRRIFVGREAELRQLEAAFDSAVSGQGGLVMVVGEPGIGKTTLTEQLQTYAALRGGKTLVGHCYEEGSLSLPYLPFVEAIRSYVLERDGNQLRSELGSAAPEVARIVSEVRDRVQVSPSPQSSNPGEDRYRLLNAVSTFLHNAAAVRPLVIVLEDLHDADRGTLDLLTFLARQLQGARLLVVGTYRDVEVDRTHPLSGTVAELRRGGRLDRLALRGLTADEVQRMLSAIAGQDVPWSLAEAVYRQTEGNPLFVQEVVRYLAEAGLITRKEGRWSPAGAPLLDTIPEGLRDVIGKRLGRLSPECNRLLAVAAVIGREFELRTLLTVSGIDEEAAIAALSEALKVAVLQDATRPGSVRYRFAHAFFRQTLYEELITPRRLRLHQQVARALELQYEGHLDEHAAELSDHFAQSSDPAELAKAVEYAARAARRALAVYAHGEAARLFEQALAVQEVLDTANPATQCDLLLSLAETLPSAGESRRAFEQTAPAGFALAEALGDRRRAWRAAHAALTALRWYGDIGALVTNPQSGLWVERCSAYAAPGTREQVLADIWVARFSEGDPAANAGRAAAKRRAWTVANTLDDEEVWGEAAEEAMTLTAENAATALKVAEAVAARSTASRGSVAAAGALLRAAQVLLAWGRYDEARALGRELHDLAERANNERLRLVVAGFEMVHLHCDGRLEEVLVAARELIERGAALGLGQTAHQIAVLYQCRPLVLLGRGEEALAAHDGWVRVMEPDPTSMNAVNLSMRAFVLAHLGRLEEAAALLDQALSQLGEQDEFGSIIILQAEMLETAILLDDRPRVGRLAEILAGTSGMALSAYTGPARGRLLGDAMRLLGRRAQAQAYYSQALSVVVPMRHRPEIALTRLELAALQVDGDSAEQAAAADHLAVAIPELEAMGLRPALERALKLRDRLSGPLSVLSPEMESDTGAPGTGISVSDENSPSPRSGQPGPQADTGSPGPMSTEPESRATGSSFLLRRSHPSGVVGVGTGSGNPRRVFISYASDDRPRALALAEALAAAGVPFWLDRQSITGGTNWDEEIVQGIKNCSVVAVLCTERALRSRNVRQELRLAMQFDRPVLPLLLEPMQFPEEVAYVLAGRQWVELLDRPQDEWLPRILQALERLD